MEFVSYGQFGFSRPDLDGNKPANGKCLARKTRDKCKGLCSGSEGRQFFIFEINSVSEGLSLSFSHLLYVLSTVSRSELINAGIINFSPIADSAGRSLQIVVMSSRSLSSSLMKRTIMKCYILFLFINCLSVTFHLEYPLPMGG